MNMDQLTEEMLRIIERDRKINELVEGATLADTLSQELPAQDMSPVTLASILTAENPERVDVGAGDDDSDEAVHEAARALKSGAGGSADKLHEATEAFCAGRGNVAYGNLIPSARQSLERKAIAALHGED